MTPLELQARAAMASAKPATLEQCHELIAALDAEVEAAHSAELAAKRDLAEARKEWHHFRDRAFDLADQRDALREQLQVTRLALEDITAHRCIRDDNRHHVCNCSCQATRREAAAALAATEEKP